MARCAGYLAGLHSCVHPRTGLTALGAPPDFPSFAAAYDAVRGVDARELEAFEASTKDAKKDAFLRQPTNSYYSSFLT